MIESSATPPEKFTFFTVGSVCFRSLWSWDAKLSVKRERTDLKITFYTSTATISLSFMKWNTVSLGMAWRLIFLSQSGASNKVVKSVYLRTKQLQTWINQNFMSWKYSRRISSVELQVLYVFFFTQRVFSLKYPNVGVSFLLGLVSHEVVSRFFILVRYHWWIDPFKGRQTAVKRRICSLLTAGCLIVYFIMQLHHTNRE